MPHPREVYDHPEEHRDFLTAPNDTIFEGQHFDRKEAGRPDENGTMSNKQLSNAVDEVTCCVSAFANSNRDGGLLVLGISSSGEIKGINHLTDENRNRLTNINQMLLNQSAEVRLFDITDQEDTTKTICLIHVPYSEHHICETPSAKAWIRNGSQCVVMNQDLRDQIRREKRIVNWETSYCCPYEPDDVDQEVLAEFRNSYLVDSSYELSDEELLREAGALTRNGSELAFTNAGFLFFAKNPQRMLPASVVRLLRFEVSTAQRDTRGLPTLDRQFRGPLPKQIRALRAFFQQSAFFKIYQRRNPEGGFIEDPEYPFIAVDEAIVNAVAHRDYATTLPIECEAYRDALVVSNSGRLLQRDHDVPTRFSLATTSLVSTPRNPLIIDWLKAMRDSQGAAFVRVLSEGTKRMRDEMLRTGLPAPEYKTTEAYTTLILYNNATEREAALRTGAAEQPTEFTNLYPLEVTSHNDPIEGAQLLVDQQESVMSALKDALTVSGWYIDKYRFGRIVAHRQGVSIGIPSDVARYVRLYPAYSIQMRRYWNQPYLSIDYQLEVKNVRTVQKLLSDLSPTELIGRTASANWDGWHLGRIVSVGEQTSKVYLFDFKEEQVLSNSEVIPNLPVSSIARTLSTQNIQFDLMSKIKEASLALGRGAARIRTERTQLTAEVLSNSVFPLDFGDARIFLHAVPAPLYRRHTSGTELSVMSVREPRVEFNHNQEGVDIREGITKFGAYDRSPRTIEIVPVCTLEWQSKMAALIQRLRSGKYRYKGSERTFSARFTYTSIRTVPSPDMTLDECKRLLSEHPDWIGDVHLDRIFLVHTPESGYSADDENAPYYQVKRFLLELGIPCQMVDSPTLDNPEWKDLNLALNITTKCGIVPWVLPDAIPDADFFLGLSYTRNGRNESERFMGYANVFNRFGRWEFYSGNTEAFPYDERTEHFKRLVFDTLSRLSLSETPHIYFHYSAKFSRRDREAILGAARDVRPQGIFTFIWINSDHNVRLYDSRGQTDGSLSRGSYVVSSPHQIYLSTTGYNPFRKAMGTPEMLEINVRTEVPSNESLVKPDLRAIAVQILGLTKLNWASTDSLCGVPITVKYASDIAYLTAAFMRQGRPFKLHPVLEKTPWFL